MLALHVLTTIRPFSASVLPRKTSDRGIVWEARRSLGGGKMKRGTPPEVPGRGLSSLCLMAEVEHSWRSTPLPVFVSLRGFGRS